MVCEQCGCHNTQMISECDIKKKQISKYKKNNKYTAHNCNVWNLWACFIIFVNKIWKSL